MSRLLKELFMSIMLFTSLGLIICGSLSLAYCLFDTLGIYALIIPFGFIGGTLYFLHKEG